MCPACMTAIWSQYSEARPRSCVIKSVAIFCEAASSAIRSMITAWVVISSPAFRIGNAHLRQHFNGAARRLRRGDIAVPQQNVRDLLANRPDRVERSARVLKDHRQFAPADLGDRPFAHLQ